jgi:hypothetical protein
MASEDLLQRTSTYELSYSDDSASTPSQNTLADHTAPERADPSMTGDFSAFYESTGRNVLTRSRFGFHAGDVSNEDNSDNETASSLDCDQVFAIPSSVVTIDCALDDSDDDDSSPAAFAERRRHDRDMLALSRMLNAHPDGDEDLVDHHTGWTNRLMSPDTEPPAFPPVRHRFPSTMRQHSLRNDNGLTPLAPHAKFFIDSESNRCSIVFDPPL